MFDITNSTIEFNMRRFIDFDGRWLEPPEQIIDILSNNRYKKILFNFLDCVDFELSGAESILRYICRTCKIHPSNVFITLYDPVNVEYATVMQGNPVALASTIRHLDYPIDNTKATKKFLALYNRYTPWRVRMAKFLQDNFREDTILSCNAAIRDLHFYKVNHLADGQEIINWVTNNAVSLQDIQNKSLLDMIKLSSEFRDNYLIEIVIETSYRILRIVTEKTMRSFLLGKPFLVYAAPGYLEMLHSMGFKTFSPIINEDYDLIENHAERFTKIQSEIERLGNLSTETLKSQLHQLHNILEHNRNLFRSGKYNLEKISWSKSTNFFDHRLFYT